MTCPHCVDADRFFGDLPARLELWAYRRSGPSRTTRMLLEAIRERRAPDGITLLDVGGGIGAIQHELLEDGAERAVSVDASGAYLAKAREEGERRGHDGRMEQLRGDFVELADRVEAADVVTLDRVVCCYPDMPALVGAAARRSRHLLGLVLPREVWWVRLGIRLINAWQALRGRRFRVFAHPTGAVIAEAERPGLRPVHRERTAAWQVMLFERRVPGEEESGPTPGGSERGPRPDQS